MRRFGIRIFLLASGGLLIAVGAAVLFLPHAFFAMNGATLGSDPSLMSEVRGPGGLLIVSGAVVLLGAFRSRDVELGLLLSALVYCGFGLSRLISLWLDGVPSTSLLTAMGTELTVGVLSLIVLISMKDGSNKARL